MPSSQRICFDFYDGRSLQLDGAGSDNPDARRIKRSPIEITSATNSCKKGHSGVGSSVVRGASLGAIGYQEAEKIPVEPEPDNAGAGNTNWLL